MHAAILTLLAISLGLQPPPSPDVGPIPVVGTVVDAAGKPVAGAEVWLTRAARQLDDRRSGMALTWFGLRVREDDRPRVLARARADGAGRFRIEIPADIVGRSDPIGLALWATHPGHAPGLRLLPPASGTGGESIAVTLSVGPRANAEMTFRDPQGKPLPVARVVPSLVRLVPIPAELGEAFASTTDAEGHATLAGLERMSVDAVRVSAAGLGVQEIAADLLPPGTPISLAPVGKVAGRLVAPADRREPLRGLAVRVRSLCGGFEGSGVTADVVAACDADGRFAIPAIAAGLLEIRVVAEGREATPLRALPVEGVVLEPGSTVERELPLRTTIRVRGEVRDRDTKRPISGVLLTINDQKGGDAGAISDASGKWEALVDREVNQPFGWPMRIPLPYYIAAGSPEPPQRMPPRGVDELRLPVLELSRGVDLRGVVRGPDGNPVEGAEVEVLVPAGEYGTFAHLTRTASDGRFLIAGVDPTGEAKLRAFHGSMTSGPPQPARVRDQKEPAVLTLRRSRPAWLGGRVVDPAGRPISRAVVRIRRRSLDGKAILAQGPAADEQGATAWRTDSDGRYRVGPVIAGDEYTVEASATGRLPDRSGAIPLAPSGQGAVASAPDLVLPGVVAVDGRVVDRAGNPVVGVEVRQSGDGPLRTKATTDDQGRFRLPGFIEGPAFLFASRDGFRRAFLPFTAGKGPVTLTLARVSEPPARAYRTLPPPLPPEESMTLARRLFTPLAEQVLAKGTAIEKFRMFRDALEVDPLAVAEKLESTDIGDGELATVARSELAAALAADHFDEATALVEAGPDADSRAAGYVAILDAIGTSDRARARQVADQAILNVRAMKSPVSAMLSARVADKLIDLGDRDGARGLLMEAEKVARSVRAANLDSYDLGIVATVLGRLDLPAALATIDDMARSGRKSLTVDRTYVFARLYGKLGYELASDSPADAERVLAMAARIKHEEANRLAVASCARMAMKDPARAHRIAETMAAGGAGGQSAWALALVADRLSLGDRPAAARVLEDAFAALDASAARGESPGTSDLAPIAGAMLPIVERVMPDRLGEFLASTLALRDPRRSDKRLASEEGAAAQLAMVIAPYDRELAAGILRPALDRLPRLRALGQQDYGTYRVLAALTLIDPKDAVSRIEAMPDDRAAGLTANTPRQFAVTSAAKLLSRQDRARWDYVIVNFLYLDSPSRQGL